MTAAEDTWHMDAQGSLRIDVEDHWRTGETFFIALNGEKGYRGACIHSNEWNKDLSKNINCDGDNGQSCGYGLFGSNAAGEFDNDNRSNPDCPNGFWSDAIVQDCKHADLCLMKGQEGTLITLQSDYFFPEYSVDPYAD